MQDVERYCQDVKNSCNVILVFVMWFFFSSLKGFVKLWLSERSSHENISFLRKELEDLAKKKKTKADKNHLLSMDT